MKGIYLFIQRMKQYIQNSRTVFALFLIGGIVNTVVMLYCYGNLLPVMVNRNEQGLVYRSYSVFFGLSPTNREDLESLVQNTLIQGVAMTDGSGLYAFLGDYPIKSAGGSVTFTDSRQIIVPVGAEAQIGDTVAYRGMEFQVIGASTWGEEYFVPWEAFRELSGVEAVTKIDVVAKERQDPFQDEVKALLQGLFPYSSSIGGTAFALLHVEKGDSQRFFSLIVIGAVMAVIAHLLLLSELLDSGRKENTVLRTVGVSKGGLAGLVLLESAAFCAVANGFGVAVHVLLYESVFTRLNMNPNIQYAVGDYCLVYLILMVLSLLAAIPILWKVAGTTPANAGREVR